MSFGLSLPLVGQASGAGASQAAVDKQNLQKPTFEVIDPVAGPVGASETASLAPVTQAAAMQADNRSNQSNMSQQFGLAALALEEILKNAGGGGAGTSGVIELDTKKSEQVAQMGLKALTPQKPSFMNGAESVKAKEIEQMGLKALTPQEPSFKKGLESVQMMNNTDRAEGESRLV